MIFLQFFLAFFILNLNIIISLLSEMANIIELKNYQWHFKEGIEKSNLFKCGVV
jgi:hypothetical protein